MYKKAAGLAASKGYTNIATFKGGIPAWVKAGYPLDKSGALPKEKIPAIKGETLAKQLSGVIVVDIRTEKLYEMGWIKDSLKLPMGHLNSGYASIPKDKPVVVVDHAGKQSLTAGRFLKSKGYSKVSRLQGGLMSWSAKGLPLEK